MSPILVRPVREQLEHDRVIRLLHAKFRRRFDVGINPGMEQNTPVTGGPSVVYPDVVLTSQERGRRVEAIIEVETVESVNNLESLAEWVPFARLRFAFHLYVPAAMVEVAKRLCADSNIPLAEIHSYHWIGDEMRSVAVYKAPIEERRPEPPMPVSRKKTSRAVSTARGPKAVKRGARRPAKAKPAKKAARSAKRK